MKEHEFFFNRQMDAWPAAAERFSQLKEVEVRELLAADTRLLVQFNPHRIVSTAAVVEKGRVERPCFLCAKNRPQEQIAELVLGHYELLVNPFPILERHFTIPLCSHQSQSIREHYADMMWMAQAWPDLFVFYNGPRCGASAPDHMHFQAGKRGIVPLERDWNTIYGRTLEKVLAGEDDVADTGLFALHGFVVPAFVIMTREPAFHDRLFRRLYAALPIGADDTEPMINILAWIMHPESEQDRRLVSVVIPRAKHRPDCYYATGDAQLLISPGAIDMGGLLITPREADFSSLTAETAVAILHEVGVASLDAMVDKLMAG